MRSLLTLVQLFNFADWIIAFFISGAAAKIEGRAAKIEDGRIAYVSTGKRTPLAVGLAVFFAAFAIWRLSEFINGVVYIETLRQVIDQVPFGFQRNNSLIAAGRTASLLFFWFAVTMEVRERKDIISGNIIRNTLARWFDKLR